MKKILFIPFIAFILFTTLVLAADWTPQGDINLRGIYQIKNATNITAQYYCNATACYAITDFLTGGGGTDYYAGGVYIYLNGSNYFILNETKLNATIELLDDDTTYSNLSELIDDLGDRGYTYLSNFTDDLGNRGYTSLSNFSNDLGFYNQSTINASELTHQGDGKLGILDSFINLLIDNRVTQAFIKALGFYDNTEVYNKTEIDTQGEMETIWGITLSTDTERTTGLAAQDECTEITGCQTSAQINSSIDARENDTYVNDQCPAGDFVKNISGDTMYCDTPAGGGDITGVYGDDVYIYNGSGSGEVTLALNETKLNNTIDSRDSDTTYSGGAGITITGTEVNHTDTSSQANSDNSGNTFIQDVILDTFGHITSIVAVAVDFSAYVAIADLVGMVGNWSADKQYYWNTSTDLDTVIDADEIAEGKIEFTTACGAGNHYYLSGNDLACEADDDTTYTAGDALTLTGNDFDFDGGASPGGELGGTWGSPTLDNDALDDQYYDSEGDLTGLLDDNYEPISAHFDASTTVNITCLDSACNWYTNATDSCMYWPSGGKDCGAA